MYERKSEPVIPSRAFAARLLRHGVAALAVIAVSLGVGMLGYALLAGMSWIDAFLNAAMILGGMGPVDALPNDAAKVFAGLYALYSGVVFLVVAGILLAPVVHRVMHTLHADDATDAKPPDGQEPS